MIIFTVSENGVPQIEQTLIEETPHASFSITWEEIGGADEIDPTFDRDEEFDRFAYQRWADEEVEHQKEW